MQKPNKYGVTIKVADGSKDGHFLKYRGIMENDLSNFLRWLDYNHPKWVYINFWQKRVCVGSMIQRDRVIRDRRR